MALLSYTTIVALFTCFFMAGTKRKSPCGPDPYIDPNRYNRAFIVLLVAVLIVAEGFRHGYEDTGNYKGLYNDVTDNVRLLLSTSSHPGWDLIQWLLRRISKHSQFICIAMAGFFTIADVWFIRRHAFSFPFSLCLYFLVSFVENLNGLRQLCAAVFLLFAFPLACERKYVRYIAVILLLSTIHRTILVIVPLSLLFMGKRWNKGIILFLLFCAFSVLVPGPINALIGAFASDDYSRYLYIYNSGADALHVVVDAVPLIMGLIYHVRHRENVGENRAIDVLINMQAISFGFMLLATRMAQYARIGAYMRHSTVLLVPFLISRLFRGKHKLIAILCAIMFYLIKFILENYLHARTGSFDSFYLDFSILQ